MTLFLDQDRDANDAARMQWIAHMDVDRTSTDARVSLAGRSAASRGACEDVALAPLDIRTFVLEF